MRDLTQSADGDAWSPGLYTGLAAGQWA
jgi:hypothetical protein